MRCPPRYSPAQLRVPARWTAEWPSREWHAYAAPGRLRFRETACGGRRVPHLPSRAARARTMLRCLAPRLSSLAGRGTALPPALSLMAAPGVAAEAAMSASTAAATPYPTYFVAGARPIVSLITAVRPLRPPHSPMPLLWPSWGGAAAVSAAMKVSSPWSQQIREGSTMKKRRTKMVRNPGTSTSTAPAITSPPPIPIPIPAPTPPPPPLTLLRDRTCARISTS